MSSPFRLLGFPDFIGNLKVKALGTTNHNIEKSHSKMVDNHNMIHVAKLIEQI